MLIEEEINQILIHAIDLLPVQSARIMRLVLSGYETQGNRKSHGCFREHDQNTSNLQAIRRIERIFQFE